MVRFVLPIALASLLPGTLQLVTYEACALRFGILPAFAVAGLV